jgi:GR25 family glycosyltransferase involved in LPS biosynthesis
MTKETGDYRTRNLLKTKIYDKYRGKQVNLTQPMMKSIKVIFQLWMKIRQLLPKQVCHTFGVRNIDSIQSIYVINLNRRPERWAEVSKELQHIVDADGDELFNLTTRIVAVDALDLVESPLGGEDVYPFYTLKDQLFVEPQPNTLPNHMDLECLIPMTIQEVAVAYSHINVWKQIASGDVEYSLILEDDVIFKDCFGKQLDQAWNELISTSDSKEQFDLFYLSYKEVKGGAQKTFISSNIFSPYHGLWYLSGYVLSRKGARKLLKVLPCKGPVDLWINHQFNNLTVRAMKQSIISQRLDGQSSNSYSILPMLNKLGAIDSGQTSLFQFRPTQEPVFAIGSSDSGLSSLAMALSMLGYRCCSDLEDLPAKEKTELFNGSTERIFNAYVNVGTISDHIQELQQLYSTAKFIITLRRDETIKNIINFKQSVPTSSIVLRAEATNKWRILCEFLKCAPPVCSYPKLAELRQRRINILPNKCKTKAINALKHDKSPWNIEPLWNWEGIAIQKSDRISQDSANIICVKDSLKAIDNNRWVLQDDTFPGNLALFRPENIIQSGRGIDLLVQQASLDIREYSAAAISSRDQFLYGRFESEIQATKIPGIVTGFFLHRNSPRQEIDIEITGNKPNKLLTNVFYNPGNEGARYDYGYRGTPYVIDLGIDFSMSTHLFAIEWTPEMISWYVDDKLIHQRSNWNPTPIPHLPMKLYINSWPSNSRELAGALNPNRLPTMTHIKTITINSTKAHLCSLHSPYQTIP